MLNKPGNSERQRLKKKAESDDQEPDVDVNTALMHGAEAVSSSLQLISDVAQVSQPGKNWCNTQNGTRGGAVQIKAAQMNYYHPYVWIHIDRAMHTVGWSPSAAAKLLQCDHPMLFSKINRGTILKWTACGKKEWSEKTLLNVCNCMVLKGSGCAGVLAGYDNVQEAINEALRGLHSSEILLNVRISQSIMIAIIKEKEPELFDCFKCSEQFVRDYYSSVLEWSPRKATCTAAHLPANAADLCKRAFFQIVYAMKWFNIPPEV